jgi:hypothetical protein
MIRELINDRKSTHGDFAATAACSQELKAIFSAQPNFSRLGPAQVEALDLLATKLARYLNGDHTNPDHLTDMMGYIQLALDDAEGAQ